MTGKARAASIGIVSRLSLTSANLMFVASNYLIHLVVARHVSVEAYGEYSLLILILTMLSVLVGSGAPTMIATNLYRPNGKSRLKRLLLFHTAIVLFFLVTLILADFWLPLFVDVKIMRGQWSLLSLAIVPLGFYGFFAAWSNALGRYYVSTGAVVIYMAGRLVATYLLLSTLNIVSIIYGYAVGSGLAVIVLLGFCRKQIKETLDTTSFSPGLGQKRDVGGFVIFGLAVTAAVGLDIYVASRMLSELEFGEFATFVTLAKVPLYVVTATLGFVWPELNAKTGSARTRLIMLCLALAVVMSASWWGMLFFLYGDLAEFLLSRAVDFDSQEMNSYYFYILVLSCLLFVWQYMNVIMDRLLTIFTIAMLLCVGGWFGLEGSLGGTGIQGIMLSLNLGVAASFCVALILIWKTNRNAKL